MEWQARSLSQPDGNPRETLWAYGPNFPGLILATSYVTHGGYVSETKAKAFEG